MRSLSTWRTYCLVFFLVFALALFYVCRRDLYGLYQDYLSSEDRVRAGHEQCDTLERELDAARQRVEHLGNDPVEIEAAIRRTKNLVREGEKVYRIRAIPSDGN